MTRLRTPGLAAVGFLFGVSGVFGWDQIIDFERFEIGATKDPASAIAQLVRITRDEGYESGRTTGFATLTVDEFEDRQKIFSFGTGGYGESWGHTFGGVNFHAPITDQGTIYFQMMVEGAGGDMSISLTEGGFEPAEPTDSNPWGWAGPDDWDDQLAVIRMDNGFIGVDDWRSPVRSTLEWVLGAWYEVWMVVDVPVETYTVYVRSPEAGIPKTTPVEVESAGMLFSEYYFRRPADQLGAVLFGHSAGNPASPHFGHRVWFNVFAFDFASHNLTAPPPMHPVCVCLPVLIYGFDAIGDLSGMRADAYNFLGADIWFGASPYAYSFDLARWMWIPRLWEAPVYDTEDAVTEPGKPRDPETYDLAGRDAEWVYIWDSPFSAGMWAGSAELGTWVWGTDDGWVYTLNLRR